MYFKGSTSSRTLYMKNRATRLLIVAFCLIGMQWACKPVQEVVIEPKAQDISIDEAKAWSVKENAKTDPSGKQSKDDLNEYWCLAQKMKYTSGANVIVVPVTYGYKHMLGYWTTKIERKEPLDPAYYSIQTKMLVFKDAKGDIKTEYIQIIPTDENRSKFKRVVGSSFSGLIVRCDKEGANPQSVLVYKDGVFVGSGKPLATRSARYAGCECCIFVNTAAGQIRLDFACPEKLPPIPSNGSAWSGSNLDFGGTGNGAGTGSSGGPYTPAMLTDNGVIGMSDIDNFLYDMEYSHAPSIYFPESEKVMIREFPALTYFVKEFVDQNGYKPDIVKLEAPVRTIKVVGRDAVDEENDYRLYLNKDDAYAYLENATLTKNKELGAYITDRGVIIGPNSQGSAQHYLLIRQVNSYMVGGNKVTDYSKEFLKTTNMGTVMIKGYIHTHILPFAIDPSGDDITVASFG